MQRRLTATHRAALLHDALAVMERDYARALQLDDVARDIATSRRQLQRCFAEHADGSFRECLTEIRMTHAAESLRGGAPSVKAVAATVGYRQPAQFAKAFRRRYGVSPTTYRAQHALDDRERFGDPDDDVDRRRSAGASEGPPPRARAVRAPAWSSAW
jgi:AraC family transcriptional regulator, regulatory protein of adaptative response / methylphosphotriester-DNA alkyltransferase methyltransferase